MHKPVTSQLAVLVTSATEGEAQTADLREFAVTIEQAGLDTALLPLSLTSHDLVHHLTVGSALVLHSVLSAETLRGIVRSVRGRNAELPIYLFDGHPGVASIPTDVVRELDGVLDVSAESEEFLARRVVRGAQSYWEGVAPPFFSALADYAAGASYSWHCPGHAGGAAFRKSPVGRMFHEFFGENLLRADACNAVEELGHLLTHTGPVAAAERNAARIFGADHVYFVTNGTSTSNKIVWNSLVRQNDIVVVDRNCHKSILHAVILTGAIPVFLQPTRNRAGIIGPIPRDEFTWETITRRTEANPLVGDRNAAPRLLTLTQGTYDGLAYDAEAIVEAVDGRVDAVHFDEAWIPHAAFHDFYRGMHAVGNGRSRPRESVVFSTQSTHKLLAGLSQASQILVQDAERPAFDRHAFSEAFMMHTSTSPQYAIIASCDVAAAMMEPPRGTALVEESIVEAMTFRQAMRELASEVGDSWWFTTWGPDDVSSEGLGSRDAWVLKPDDPWHGFEGVTADFTMLDPIKVTVMTPGLDSAGRFTEPGIPATVVSRYLAERGSVVEKTGLYSFFIMFTIGVTRGRAQVLLSELRHFKHDYDRNVPVERAMPDFAARHERYARMGLRDLCDEIHALYSAHDLPRLLAETDISAPVPAMKPADAWDKMVHREIERVPLDAAEGHVAAALLAPFPPGIPWLVPGERFDRPIVRSLQVLRAFNRSFPGLGVSVPGLIGGESDEDEWHVACVRRRRTPLRPMAAAPLRRLPKRHQSDEADAARTVTVARSAAAPTEANSSR